MIDINSNELYDTPVAKPKRKSLGSNKVAAESVMFQRQVEVGENVGAVPVGAEVEEWDNRRVCKVY